MHCSYCGKEIGALRLLRDSEFCSASHRQSYKERLGRVLNQISDEQQAPPPPPAGFLLNVLPAPGNVSYTMDLWQAGHHYPLRNIVKWPLSVPDLGHLQARPISGPGLALAEEEPYPIPDLESEDWVHEAAYPELHLQAEVDPPPTAFVDSEFEDAPGLCHIFSIIPLPEFTERWLNRSFSGPCAPAVPLASMKHELRAALDPTPVLCGCQPIPAAEPAATWISSTASAMPVEFVPDLYLLDEQPGALVESTPELAGPVDTPSPEPAARWIGNSAAVARVERALVQRLMGDMPHAVLHASPETGEWVPVAGPEPVAVWIAVRDQASPIACAPALRLPLGIATIAGAELPHAAERATESALIEGAVAPTSARATAAPPSGPVVPAFTLQAELEALPESLEIPAHCEGLVQIEEAEPLEAWCARSGSAAPAKPSPDLSLPPAIEIRTRAELPISDSRQIDPALVQPATAAASSVEAVAGSPDLALPPGVETVGRAELPHSGSRQMAAELVQPSAAIPSTSPVPAAAVNRAIPGFRMAEAFEPPPICEFPFAMPAAEPVAAWLVRSEFAVSIPRMPALRLPAGIATLAVAELPIAAQLSQEISLAGPATTVASAPAPASVVAAPAMPAFTVSAELEPLASPDELLEIPAACQLPIRPLQAEPVWSFLNPARASEMKASIPPARPVLAGAILGAKVPMATLPRLGPQPEPVMSGVWPRVAEAPLEAVDPAPEFGYPRSQPAIGTFRGFAAAGSVPSAAPEPAEALRVASRMTVPLCGGVPLQLPMVAAVAANAGTVALALPVAGPQAQPAEIWIAAACAGPMTAIKPLVMQPFQVGGVNPTAIAVPEVPSVAAAASEPAKATSSIFELRPVSTIRLVLPEQRHKRATPAIPRPGVVAIEYHTQRMRGAAYSRPEWKSVTYEPIAPEFAMRAALDNPEDLIKAKAPLGSVFPINARSQRYTRSAVMEHILRVAAAVLIVTTIWTGAQALKNARRISVRQEDTAFATPSRVLTPEAQKAATKQAAEGKGPVNWLRQTVANRASVQVADDFQGSMQRWGAPAGAMPANWRRNRDGYVQTGALAILAPTTKFSDYKLEFFGQIENKSLGWVVRAKDSQNYHAMKFTVLERGLRPIIAMVHYDVIEGRAGRRTQIPLNVMVHNNRPFQVAVTLKGKHFVTEVDGEEVDNFREDLLPTGGVGFFSEAGEQARLYWTRVTKNDDWLGHVCAFLSGGDSQATAELWPPSVPGRTPAPGAPAGDSTLLTAAWIGLPSIRRTQSSRRQKRCNR